MRLSTILMRYRLTSPLVVLPVGSEVPITLPVGTEIERDDFRKTVGLTEVFVDGKRLTVMVHDLDAGTEPVGETG
jgi:hypothetical protein